MAMNDEETVALIAGGHTFGKTHGAGDPSLVGPEPEGARASRSRASAGRASIGTGMGGDAITSGPEVTWTQTPTKWSNHFFENLFGYEWELTKSPAGAQQWMAKNAQGRRSRTRTTSRRSIAPTMLTTDLVAALRPGLREDLAALLRASGPVRRRLRPRLVQADAPRHGPDRALSRPAGAEGGADLAGPDPGRRSPADRRQGHRRAEGEDPRPRACRSPQLVSTAWASASTFRGSDKRGGANGARIRLAPQKDWEVNQPAAARARCCRSSKRSRRSSTPRRRAARRSRSPT